MCEFKKQGNKGYTHDQEKEKETSEKFLHSRQEDTMYLTQADIEMLN